MSTPRCTVGTLNEEKLTYQLQAALDDANCILSRIEREREVELYHFIIDDEEFRFPATDFIGEVIPGRKKRQYKTRLYADALDFRFTLNDMLRELYAAQDKREKLIEDYRWAKQAALGSRISEVAVYFGLYKAYVTVPVEFLAKYRIRFQDELLPGYTSSFHHKTGLLYLDFPWSQYSVTKFDNTLYKIRHAVEEYQSTGVERKAFDDFCEQCSTFGLWEKSRDPTLAAASC